MCMRIQPNHMFTSAKSLQIVNSNNKKTFNIPDYFLQIWSEFQTQDKTWVQIRTLCHSPNSYIDNPVYVYFPTNIIMFFYLIQKLRTSFHN